MIRDLRLTTSELVDLKYAIEQVINKEKEEELPDCFRLDTLPKTLTYIKEKIEK